VIWVKTGYRIAVVTTILSLMNCLVNVSYAILALKLPENIPANLHYSHTLATNIIFGVKCASLIFWGLANAYGWFDRIGHLLRPDRRARELSSDRETNRE